MRLGRFPAVRDMTLERETRHLSREEGFHGEGNGMVGLVVRTDGCAQLGSYRERAQPVKGFCRVKGPGHINEGITHYEKGHWDVAKKYFFDAAQEDPKSAEAHYDVGLVLDRMGDHEAATVHFKKAQELGTNNPQIQNSEILKKHVKMESN